MSAVPTTKKRERQPPASASARHSGERGNPPTSSFRTPRSGDPESSSVDGDVSGKANLGDLLTIIRGVTYKKNDASAEPLVDGVPILRATNIQDGLLTFDGLVYVPRRYVADDQLLRVGDIVVAASSGSRSVVGKAAPLKSAWFGSFGAFCFGLRPKPGIDPNYLAWFLQTSEYRRQVSELAAGVNINNLRAKHIEQIPIPVPTVERQRTIVAEIEKQFTRLDAGVAALRRVQANLKRYRAAVLKAACEGRLVPTEAELAKAEGRTYETGEQLLARILADRRKNWHGRGRYKEPAASDITNLPSLPEGWAWTNIGQLAEVGTGATPARGNHEFYAGGTIPWVTSGAVNSPRIERADQLVTATALEKCNLTLYPPGTLLLAMYGEGKTRGMASELMFSATTNQALAAIEVSKVLRSFIKVVLWKNYDDVRKTASGGVQPNLNLSLVRAIRVALPPLAEQTRIVAEAERRLSLIEELEAAIIANLQRATRLRQSVLARAFAG